MMRIQNSRIAWLGLMVLVAGCGGNASDQQKLSPVTGTVTLDGKPLSGAVITFVPTGATHGTGARGRTDDDGKYELATRSRRKGAPAGDYRVMVSKMVLPDGSDSPANSVVSPMDSHAREVLPAIYSVANQTLLIAKVGDNDNVIDFPLSTRR